MAAAVIAARGQTQIDLRTQGRNIDFSTAASTRPSKTGTSLPAACSTGETFLKTDAPAGKNLYVCTASGVWTVQGVEVPNPTGKSDQVLSNDGSGFLWQALGGDIAGPPGALVVTGLSGRKLSSVVPLDGQFLKWNGALQQWEATTLAGALSVFGRTGAIAAQTGDYSFPQISGTIAGSQLPAANGDLSGALPGPTVVKLQGRTVSATTPLTGQFLGWDGAQWTPQNTVGSVASLFGRTGAVTAQTGDYSFAQISGSVATGQMPGVGGDLTGTLTSATVSRLQNRPMASLAPSLGQVLTWDGSQWTPLAASSGGGGGVNGLDKTVSNTYTAGAKQTFVPSLSTSGVNVTPGTLPTNAAAGDVSIDSGDSNKLKIYDGAQWNTLASVSNYTTTFTAQTLVTVNGTTHRLGTANLIVDCYDNSSPSSQVEPDRVVIDQLVFNVSIYFASAQTGHCVITGSSGASTGGERCWNGSAVRGSRAGANQFHGADRRSELFECDAVQCAPGQHRVFGDEQQHDHAFDGYGSGLSVRRCIGRPDRGSQFDVGVRGSVRRGRRRSHHSRRARFHSIRGRHPTGLGTQAAATTGARF